MADSQAAFKGRASPPKPANWIIAPGLKTTVGGLTIGMSKSQALAAWGRPSFCSRTTCTWFTRRQRRDFYFAGDSGDYKRQARGNFAHIVLRTGRVKNIMLGGFRGPYGGLDRFKIDNRVGLGTGYEAMQRVFPPNRPCPSCLGGPATVRTDRLNRRTFVFYLNSSGVYGGSGGVMFERWPTAKIGFISIK